eukprot:CAMPEP_0116894634 /NCGR_PEP_ID=MMETSP0467-20121206/4360_1 /TAXON_ID=283647 /ORGANISM="Mesodinium pulex, Strain SPMC105" /LENGTH=80 /DNA_ID=CAMNT_0004564965 /DNA_START=69 /DNA_END=311 /DNA_ORIENTATION=+
MDVGWVKRKAVSSFNPECEITHSGKDFKLFMKGPMGFGNVEVEFVIDSGEKKPFTKMGDDSKTKFESVVSEEDGKLVNRI